MATALSWAGPDYYASLRREYQERRDLLLTALEGAGFQVTVPAGTYFILAGFSKLWDGDDRIGLDRVFHGEALPEATARTIHTHAPESGIGTREVHQFEDAWLRFWGRLERS